MTLFDTSVLIDARDADSPWHAWAKEQIAGAVAGDGAAANAIVVSEASVRAVNRDSVPAMLEQFGMTLVPLPVSAAVPAAKAFALYLDRLKKDGKKTESRIPLPDFLIGAHAEAECLKLVTRDPDRVRRYFPKVELIVP
jgi:predicted nucleic acid-binding protein